MDRVKKTGNGKTDLHSASMDARRSSGSFVHSSFETSGRHSADCAKTETEDSCSSFRKSATFMGCDGGPKWASEAWLCPLLIICGRALQ